MSRDEEQNLNWELPGDLKALEAKLARLRPRDDRLDRERLAFLAGQASVRKTRIWPAAFAGMTAVAAALLVLASRPAAEVEQAIPGQDERVAVADREKRAKPNRDWPIILNAPVVRVETMSLRSLEQCVNDAQVIVVATAFDSAPAPPKRPGDPPENFIRFRVARVLKGNLADQVITTRTPTSANEFIGHEWVVMLSPEYLAGNHPFAGCYGIKYEPEVMAVLAKDSKSVQRIVSAGDAYNPEIMHLLTQGEFISADDTAPPTVLPSRERDRFILTPSTWHRLLEEPKIAQPSPNDSSVVNPDRGVNS